MCRTWIAALRHGATERDLDALLAAVQPIIDQLMGRQALYEWTLLQLKQACLHRKPLTSYATFVQSLVKNGKIDLNKEESTHTEKFLKSVEAGTPALPIEFFRKLGIGCDSC